MPCNNPLIAYPSRNPNDKRLRFCGSFRKNSNDFLPTLCAGGEYVEPIKIPCGKCLGCRLDYAKMWSDRIVLESMNYEYNWFVTLTYDDDNLRFSDISGVATLVPDDVTLFIKKLREYYRTTYDHIGIRYYYSGEYGDSSARPHYHLCFFNLPLDDLIYYNKSPLGDIYYNSPLLEKLWSFGFVVVGELTYSSAGYTARYVTKKAKKYYDKELLFKNGVVPEFVRMSRRPGIASSYYQENISSLLKGDKIYLPDGKLGRVPRYYVDKFKEVSEKDVAIYKSNLEEVSRLQSEYRRAVNSIGEREYLCMQERLLEKRTKSLIRDL